MSEWWTYHLANFLLFSPRTYYRLFELYNAAIWPAQVAAAAMAIGIAALLRRSGSAAGRTIAGILAAAWLWSGIGFHALRYATINWGAVYFAWLFGVEAALLAWSALARGGIAFERPADLAGRAGLAIFLFAGVVQPLAGPLVGRSWRAIEVFAAAPDPTAVATLGILLLARVRRRWLLMIAPVLWCALTGTTLLAMDAPDWWIAPAIAASAVALAWRTRAGYGSLTPSPHGTRPPKADPQQ
jgi:Family of unknown function (DUF6064)